MKSLKKHFLSIAVASFVGLVGIGIGSQTNNVDAASKDNVITVNYVPNYGIAIWDSPEAGQHATGKYLQHGTSWKTFATQVVNGKTWYNLGGAQWIDSTYTIDGYAPIAQAPAHPDYTSQINTYPWGQCTYYVKMVAPWVGNYWGNGNQWGASAKKVGFKVDNQPAAGSVVSFASNQWVGGWQADPYYGHVAYVKSYNPANNTITITQGGMGFRTPTGPNTQVVSGASNFTYIHR